MAEYLGKTIEEAIENGLKELQLTQDQVEIEVIDQPVKGFLGINSKKAKVSITKKATDGERAITFLSGLFDLMKIPTTTDLTEQDNKIIINLTTTTSSTLIGYRGEVLDSLQCLAGAVANTGREDYRRVVVDCEGYRNKREETLINLAHKLANKAVKTTRKVTLEPMNPFERRIIHAALADNTTVKTVSEGKEPNRYIAIIPEGYKPSYRDNKGDRKDFNRDGRKPYNKDGRKPYNKDGKPYNNDRKPYNKEGKPYNRENRPYNNDRKAQPKKTGGYGTFIGNSLKNKEETTTEE